MMDHIQDVVAGLVGVSDVTICLCAAVNCADAPTTAWQPSRFPQLISVTSDPVLIG